MSILEYFKLDFKKPELNEDNKKAISRNNELTSNLEICYSRLESVEICASNGKNQDAILLSNYLLVDLVNLALSFFFLSKISSLEEIFSGIEKIPDSEISELLVSLRDTNKNQDISEENIETIIEKIEITISGIEKVIKTKYKEEINDIQRNYKKRIFFQSIFISIFLIFGVFQGYKLFLEKSPLKKDSTLLSFSDNKDIAPTNNIKITAELNPDEKWQTIIYKLEKPSAIGQLVIEPIHQKKARIQIKEIKYFKKDSIVLNSSFLLTQENLLVLPKFVKLLEGLELGQVKIGSFLEIVSKSEKSVISFLIESPLKEVDRIEITVRYIKKSKKFKD